MIYGVKYWNDRSRYVTQTNNAEEMFLKALKTAGEADHWQESCGPSSAVSLVNAMLDVEITIPLPGGGHIQPEDALFDWMNDPNNWPVLKIARPNLVPGTLPGNRVPQYYRPAVRAVLTGAIDVTYVEGLSFEQVCQHLKLGHGVQLCLVKPGHYIPAVAWDDALNVIIFNDTVPDREGVPGFNRVLTKTDWANVKPFANIFTMK